MLPAILPMRKQSMHIHNKIDIIDSLIETLVTCTNQEPRTKNQESRIKKRYLNVEEDDGEILKPVVVTKPCLYSITQCFAKHHRLLSTALSISCQFYILIRVCNPLGANSFLSSSSSTSSCFFVGQGLKGNCYNKQLCLISCVSVSLVLNY